MGHIDFDVLSYVSFKSHKYDMRNSEAILNWGVTKHRNGTERNGIYRNEPEYTGTRRNDAGTKGNGQEWNRNG